MHIASSQKGELPAERIVTFESISLPCRRESHLAEEGDTSDCISLPRRRESYLSVQPTSLQKGEVPAGGIVTYESISLPCRRENYLSVQTISLQKGETVHVTPWKSRVTCFVVIVINSPLHFDMLTGSCRVIVTLQISKNTKCRRSSMSLQLRTALHDSVNVAFQRSFVIHYARNHQNHYMGPVCQFVT